MLLHACLGQIVWTFASTQGYCGQSWLHAWSLSFDETSCNACRMPLPREGHHADCCTIHMLG